MMCGAGIDVYWVRLDDDIIDLGPPIDIEGFDGNREHAYLWTNSVLKIGAGDPVETAGGAYVHDDANLKEEDVYIYRSMFRDAEDEDGRPARLFQNLSERVSDRYPGLLERFVNLALVSRWGKVYGPNPTYPGTSEVYCRVPLLGPAVASMDKINYKLEGALVAVTGVAEEGAYLPEPYDGDHYDQGEFKNVMECAVAHELCHLLVGNQHPAKGDSTALMGDPPGRDGISAVSVKLVTREEIDVQDKQSVP